MRLLKFEATNTGYAGSDPAQYPFEIRTNIIIEGVSRGSSGRTHRVKAQSSSSYLSQNSFSNQAIQTATAICIIQDNTNNYLAGFQFANGYSSFGANQIKGPSLRVYVHRDGEAFGSGYTTTGL